MAEYINKKDALKFLAQLADEAQKDAEDYGGESIIYAECLKDVIADFERLPVECSVRFVPVVRCKDCKHYLGLAECEFEGHFSGGTNYFCADGERKNDGI